MSERSDIHNVIVQIKIKLLRVSEPPVWRQLQLRADTGLDHLHEIIQAAFGWENYHMHCFSSDGQGFGVPDPELGVIDERKVGLDELIGGIARPAPLHLRLRRRLGARDPRRGSARPRPRAPLPRLGRLQRRLPTRRLRRRLGLRRAQGDPRRPNHEQHPEMLEWLGLDDASQFDPGAVATDHIEYELALSGAGR